MKRLWCLLPVMFFALPAAAGEKLSRAEVASLQAGKLVTHVRELKGEVWPEITVYAAVPGSPATGYAAYADFGSHTRFIPGLLRSDIYRGQHGEEWVQTEMKLPWPLENAFCTTRVTRKREGDSYEISYTFVEGNHMKGMFGSVRFLPFNGGTLFVLTSHTTPKSPLAGLWTPRVPGEVEAAVKATVKHLTAVASATRVASAKVH